jgi:hypothetical protein
MKCFAGKETAMDDYLMRPRPITRTVTRAERLRIRGQWDRRHGITPPVYDGKRMTGYREELSGWPATWHVHITLEDGTWVYLDEED